MNKATMTKAQRQRKLDQAVAHMEKARALLVAVCDDYAERSYSLTYAERQDWANAVALVSPVERALNAR